jgi:hypothetical protein
MASLTSKSVIDLHEYHLVDKKSMLVITPRHHFIVVYNHVHDDVHGAFVPKHVIIMFGKRSNSRSERIIPVSVPKDTNMQVSREGWST